MIALVTGIAIAAFVVVILDLWMANCNSEPRSSKWSKTEASSGKLVGWI